MTFILGVSAFYHDSAAALLKDGRIVAAAQEERFSRKKHDASYPRQAIDYCLAEAGVSLGEIEFIVFYEKPFLKFERLLESYVAVAPKGFKSFCMAMPIWLKEKLFQKKLLLDELKQHDDINVDASRLLFSEHHLSHAASAYYPSPFDDAVVLTIDGVGEWATASVAIARREKLEVVKQLHFPHSLGLLYSAFTYYTGFEVNGGEYKLMGLAPYGKPRFRNKILESLVDVKPDGSFRLDQSFFGYLTGLKMINRRFEALFGAPARDPASEPLTQFHMDIAASIQSVTEEIMLKLTRSLAAEFDSPNLCLAGGVALNCVANGKILRDGAFKKIWIQPAAGDAGGALGAAYAAWHQELGHRRHAPTGDAMHGAYLGPSFSQVEIEKRLLAVGAVFETLDDKDLIERTTDALAEGAVVGWRQGRAEFGPRALGACSILADPRSPRMQRTLNLKIKNRESFRPFAPSVLREHVADWFELDCDSPYMLLVAQVTADHRSTKTEKTALSGFDRLSEPGSDVPAVTHVDGSARIQTVHAQTNPRFHALISAFHARTGCPMLVNTSFNVRDEPIVLTPEDAFNCFMGTEMDLLVIGDCVLSKRGQRRNENP